MRWNHELLKTVGGRVVKGRCAKCGSVMPGPLPMDTALEKSKECSEDEAANGHDDAQKMKTVNDVIGYLQDKVE